MILVLTPEQQDLLHDVIYIVNDDAENDRDAAETVVSIREFCAKLAWIVDEIQDPTVPEVLYATYRQSDMTEGRGPMVQFGPVFRTVDEAWEAVNTLPGVQGSLPSQAWRLDKTIPTPTWQAFKFVTGREGDYAVRPIHRLNPEFDAALKLVPDPPKPPADALTALVDAVASNNQLTIELALQEARRTLEAL